MGVKEIARLAGEQHGVVSGSQLREVGLDSNAIKRAVASGRLHRLHGETFAVGHEALSMRGRWLAAVFAAGPLGALARWSAGRLLGYLTRPEPNGTVEVAVRLGHPRPRSLRALRLASIEHDQLIVRDGIPCTSPSRTLCDLASVLSVHQLERAVERAEFQDELDVPEITAIAESIDRMRGVRNLRVVLGTGRLDASKTGSELERLALRLWLDAGFGRPLLQQTFVIGDPPRQIRVDFSWPEAGLVVEVDGPHHRRPLARRRDAERDAGLRALGLTVIRIDYEMLEQRPHEAIALVRAALGASR